MDLNSLRKAFSAPRINKYVAVESQKGLPLTTAESNALIKYRENIENCSALLPILNCTEILLRNTIHRQITYAYGREDWWEDIHEEAKFSNSMDRIRKAESTLVKKKKNINPDAIISELSFGFWSGLFESYLDELIFTKANLKNCFPRCPKSEKKRDSIHKKINEIRNLRNRVFHHEPILWMKNPSIIQIHESCKELIFWIDPKTSRWIAEFDEFERMNHANDA